MYRARADAVSGTKVFADGKWLTCIGNKNVRVGEYIWTDGRCVYGNNRVSQQPMVITAGKDDGEAIPILMLTNYNEYSCLTYKKLLKEVAKKQTQLTPLGHWVEDDEDEEAGGYYINEDRPHKIINGTMINDYDGNVVCKLDRRNNLVYDDCYVVNIDQEGNYYEMRHFGKSLADFKIFKNEELVREIFLTDVENLLETEVKNTLESLSATVKADPLYRSGAGVSQYLTASSIVINEFIENENEWAAVVAFWCGSSSNFTFVQQADCVRCYWANIGYFGWSGPYFREHPGKCNVEAVGKIKCSLFEIYLITQDGYQKISSRKSEGIEFKGGEVKYSYYILMTLPYLGQDTAIKIFNDEYGDDRFRTVTFPDFGGVNIGSTSINNDVKIPLQDGFCYTINSIHDEGWIFPFYMSISIFAAEGKLLLTDTFLSGSCITIQKIGSKFLLGVKVAPPRLLDIVDYSSGSSFWWDLSQYNIWLTDSWLKSTAVILNYPNVPSRLRQYIQNTDFVDNGLYEIKDGKLTKIADGACLNQRLRPMKKYKNWQERIQGYDFDDYNPEDHTS